MVYTYDVLANFNDEVIEVYEWESTDVFETVRKIPLFKVDGLFYRLLITNNLVVDKSFLEVIKDKTLIYNESKIETLIYGAIFTDGDDSVIVIFNEKGNIMELSKLLYDEECEVLDLARAEKKTDIKYKPLNKKTIPSFLTRMEKRTISLIINELSNIKEDKDKINYLYYEWFGGECEEEDAYSVLLKEIKKGFTSKHEELYNIIKLIVKNC